MSNNKFRVWDKKNKKMLGVAALSIHENMFMPDNIGYQDFYNYDNNYYSCIMQNTGLIDKEGIEIYDGDIITIAGSSIKNYEVEYVLGCYGISTEKGFSILADYTTSLSDGTNATCKVIGHIYEK